MAPTPEHEDPREQEQFELEEPRPAEKPPETQRQREVPPPPLSIPAPDVAAERPGEVSIRSRPPIFYFWPTLIVSLLFMAITGLQDVEPAADAEAAAPQAQQDGPAQQADEAEGEAEAADADQAPDAQAETGGFPALPRSLSLIIVLVFLGIVIVYFAIHPLLVLVGRPDLVERWDAAVNRNVFWTISPLDIFWLFVLAFLIFSPGYGLLVFLAFYAFGLMTDHSLFTAPRRLRWNLFWVLVGLGLAVVLTVLRDSGGESVEYSHNRTLSMIFFAALAFNLFVLAFDFNGATLVTLVAVVVALVAIFVVWYQFNPAVGRWIGERWNEMLQVEINSSFYKLYGYVLAMLMVFSGLVAKADFWQISPLAIVHYEGLIVQRNRHYGALVHFHYYVEFPDFFESVLGFGAGNFILSLPREERPVVLEHVWYARYYNRKIQELLSHVDITEDE